MDSWNYFDELCYVRRGRRGWRYEFRMERKDPRKKKYSDILMKNVSHKNPKVTFCKKRGLRIKNHDFSGLTIHSRSEEAKYWFYSVVNNWVDDSKLPRNHPIFKTTHSTHAHPHSLKAAIRMVKNAAVPVGTVFVLVSKWVGHDIYITKR